jgi:hypothetical protein
MTKLRHLFCIPLLLLLAHSAKAQPILIDSLRHALTKDVKPESRIMTMAHLARALFFKDIHEAINLEQQALMLGQGLKDGQYKAFTYGTLATLYVEIKDYSAARSAIDSALWYAGHTENKVVQGFVWFRKGWMEYFDEKYDKAMQSFLASLKYLEGQEAYNYENLIYYYIAGIYWTSHEADKHDKYARMSWEAALKSKDPDDICRGYQALGSGYLARYRRDTANRALLDSALYYNRLSLRVAEEQKGRLIYRNTTAIAALNNGDIYFEYYPHAYKDSAEKYINIALGIAREVRYPEVVANCYGILSEYAVREGKYDNAEKILLMGLAEAENDSSSGDFTKARMLVGLANVAEKSGDPAKALRYYKDYTKANAAYFDAEKLATTKKLEAQYESEKKGQALAALEERAAFNKKLNFFYICLIIAGVLALIFLFRSYHFRLKASQRQQLLLAKEKEDVALQSQLQAAEAKRLELEKQEALLQASLRSEEAARLQAEQQLLQERQERLQKELLAGTLRVEEKNELLQTLREKITEQPNSGSVLKQMDRIINENRRLDEDFETLKADFAEIHPEFFVQLQEKAQNNLTRLDLKYCSYILMGLSNKEIANRLAVEPKSIRMARYRIKQKLGLQKDENLDLFIQAYTNRR